jgi:hypothetical protein
MDLHMAIISVSRAGKTAWYFHRAWRHSAVFPFNPENTAGRGLLKNARFPRLKDQALYRISHLPGETSFHFPLL